MMAIPSKVSHIPPSAKISFFAEAMRQNPFFLRALMGGDTFSPYCRPQWGIILGSEVPLRSELNELVRSTRLEF